MKRQLKPELQKTWRLINDSSILNDFFIMGEFKKRGLKMSDIGQVTLTFYNNLVHVAGHLSTESHSCEIAIKKHMIQYDIVSDDNNYIEVKE